MTLRDKIHALAKEAHANLVWKDGRVERVESAILAGIKLVLKRKPSEEICAAGLDASVICIREYYANGKYTGNVRSFSDKECGDHLPRHDSSTAEGTGGKMTWEKLPAIEGGHGGCLHCGYQHDVLPMDAIIAVGFGSAFLTRDSDLIYDEQGFGKEHEDAEGYVTAAKAEELAAADPDHDWRIGLVAPLSERHYQRQGEKHWVLYEKGQGFA